MSYLGSWAIDNLLTFPANTHRFDTGAAVDADSAPSYRIYEDETATPILTGSMALLDSANTVGFYTEQITLSAANGFEKGKSYTVYIVATVNSVTATMSHSFQIEAEVDANTVSDKTGYGLANGAITAAVIATDAIDADAIADNAIDAGAIAANAITSAKIATDAIGATQLAGDAVTEIQSGLATAASIAALNNLSAAQVNAEVDTALADINLDHLVGTATGIPAIPAGTYIDQMTDDGTAVYDRTTDSLQAIRDRGDVAWVTGSVLTQADVRTAVGLASANLDTQLGAIDGVTDKLDTTLEVDGLVYRFTANALEQAPAGGGGGGTGLINFVYGGEWILNQQNRIDFYLQDAAGAAVTGLGAGFTLTLAKNGAAFAASAGTKAEIGGGWYTYLATAGEANTIGTIAVQVVGAGAVEQNLEYVVKQRTAGAIAFTYTVTNSVTTFPESGVAVWITTDIAGANIIWVGITDVLGVARDSGGSLPYLDPGTYFFWKQKSGFVDAQNPDQETVS